jgi:hypothetical protein
MIIFDLKCTPQSHVFEGWFGSSADYEAQRGRGLVACPICGSADIAKAPMAPAVAVKGNAGPASGPAANPEQVKAMLAAAAAVQKQMLARSEAVGDRFASEARAIHLGEVDARSIHGRATPDEAQSLAEEGIPIASLPFPVVEPGDEN